jgi:hypothetical protein
LNNSVFLKLLILLLQAIIRKGRHNPKSMVRKHGISVIYSIDLAMVISNAQVYGAQDKDAKVEELDEKSIWAENH